MSHAVCEGAYPMAAACSIHPSTLASRSMLPKRGPDTDDADAVTVADADAVLVDEADEADERDDAVVDDEGGGEGRRDDLRERAREARGRTTRPAGGGGARSGLSGGETAAAHASGPRSEAAIPWERFHICSWSSTR